MPVDDPGIVALFLHLSSFGSAANRDVESGVVMGVERAVGRDLAFPRQVCVSSGWARRSLVLHEEGAVSCSTGTLESAWVVAERPGDPPFALRFESVGNAPGMAPPFPVWSNWHI